MPIPLARCFRGIVAHAADAIMPARLMIADGSMDRIPKPKPTGAAPLRRLMEGGRAIGLLDDGEDEVTLARHEARRVSVRGR